ncbi:MAG: hypothetical protein JW984_01745 [Deltaproteobacteria bacterium]|uniref:Uncharacterized protein n=1 Tax=Candidatus Zymogenus saltonus TaxID=2844893 RepID=A0A9D8KBC8_9DELT|nr:hypothetical protein [Candidatus Zymogenus saltonus]
MKKIIDNKDEKIVKVLKKMDESFTLSDFVEGFKKYNREDYERLEERFVNDEKNVRIMEWKKHSMPTPEKYLLNALKEYLKRNKNTITVLKGNKFKKVSAAKK